MACLLIGDPHFSDRPRDAYRFDIFKWIREKQEKYNVDATYILGDMCDNKDRHSSSLVNRIVTEMLTLKPPVYILKGNHDYIDPNNPFFKFLNHVQGIQFIVEPTQINRVLFIPHTPTEKEFEQVCKAFEGAKLDLVLMHTTFEGAIAETGVELSGYNQAALRYLKPRHGFYAGDVHRPQRAANAVYVGAPYHIRFGDDFDPRCVLIDDTGQAKNLYFDTIRKWSLTIRDASELIDNKDLLPNDQVKITVELAREEAVEWKNHKQQVLEAAKKKGLSVFGVDLKVNSGTPKKTKITDTNSRLPDDVFASFCKAENVATNIKQTGLMLLKF